MTNNEAKNHRHLTWGASLVAALLLMFAVWPLSDSVQEYLATEQKKLSAQKTRLELQIQQWAQDAQTAQKLAQTLSSADVENLLAPMNRKEMTAQLEPLASASRLARMTYTLSPAQSWNGGDQFPGINDVTVSTLSLEADAPEDDDSFMYIQSLSELPGQFELHELELHPLTDAPNIAPRALNLHMKAILYWLANAENRGP
ncbi:MAG: hypothetical protein PHD48_04370 [Alphaproteobacteria bacterium]|nr:hypothetical protein [Alphaproteobacteria bacterium]